MADYKELIRKAIQALPENNGAARRAVYEKARAALVGQLRGLNPPLAARDITQHRLQLEDCIRQVEQEASEAVIAGLKQNEELPPPAQRALPPPRTAGTAARPATTARPNGGDGLRAGHAAPVREPAGPARPNPLPARPAAAAAAAKPSSPPPSSPMPRIAAVRPQTATAVAAVAAATRPAPAVRPVPRPQPVALSRAAAQSLPAPDADYEPDTIEDIIAAAEHDAAEPEDIEDEAPDEVMPEPRALRAEIHGPRKPAAAVAAPITRGETRPLPAIVARAEAAKAGRSARPAEVPPPRRSNGNDNHHAGPKFAPRAEDAQPIEVPRPTNSNTALSSVREVNLEQAGEGDPQGAIERAIATLEREARNDGSEINGVESEAPPRSGGRRRNALDREARDEPMATDSGFARAPVERETGGGNAVTIFLLVFLVLLIAAGGAGLWAWREGFIDLDAMFGKPQATVSQTGGVNAPVVATPAGPTAVADAGKPASTPAPTLAQTNTEPASNTPAQSSAPLSAAPATTPPAAAAVEPSAQTGEAPKSEDRLTQSPTGSTAPAVADVAKPAAGGTTAAPAGSQSLLLEASQDGTTGAVPFSGTVEWSKGTDEMGQPTLVGKASIPARNLGVSVLIRKNSDPTLPASHLMEINFTVNDAFIGGSIAGLPGVLLKNEELVQGTPLVGASARVVGNSFLFALSSSPADEATNKDLLTSRKWMDLAIIYATGKKAIITLEKDDKTEQLFSQVFDAWSKEASTAPAAAAPAAGK